MQGNVRQARGDVDEMQGRTIECMERMGGYLWQVEVGLVHFIQCLKLHNANVSEESDSFILARGLGRFVQARGNNSQFTWHMLGVRPSTFPAMRLKSFPHSWKAAKTIVRVR